MAGLAMAGSFFQLTCPTQCYLCSSCVCSCVPRLNSGKLAIYSCGHVDSGLKYQGRSIIVESIRAMIAV